ncbi:MAG: GNAT family N-acetyltransferase [Elainellaceae cyanobacterium]
MSHVTIRHATPSDLSAIVELIHLKAIFDGCPESVEATPAALEQTLFSGNPFAFVLLAETEGEIVGMASYHRIYSTFLARSGLWLDDLYLREDCRGKAIGKALMVKLCRIADEMGAGRIDWTVDLGNDRAIGFYEHLGAKRQTHVQLCRCDRPAIKHLAHQNHPPE